MCSGCSGDYAGDFEDSGEPAGDSEGDQPAWSSGRPEGDADAPDRSGFEPPVRWQEDPQSESARSSSPAPSQEICEIVVSATRIVEIRVITVNPEEVFEFSTGKGAGKHAAGKHSEAASAKYYQTRSAIPEVICDRIEGPIFCGVAACLVGEFRKWSRWARNAVRKAYSWEFHRS